MYSCPPLHVFVLSLTANHAHSISSYTWKSAWGPDYHPSMFIGIGALTLATLLAFVVRSILARQNAALEREELAGLVSGAHRERIEEAARLEGISFEEALRRRRGFRYLL